MKKTNLLDIIHHKQNLNEITINNRFQAILVFFIFLKLIMYANISYAHAAKYFILVSCIVGTSVLTEILYYKFVKKLHFNEAVNVTRNSYPQIIGLVIATVITYGYHFRATSLCVFFGIIFARLFFGGYKRNVFDCVSFSIVLMHSSYKNMTTNSSMNSSIDNFLLNLFNAENSHHIVEVSNLSSTISMDRLPYLSEITIVITFAFTVLFLILLKKAGKKIRFILQIFLFLFILSFSFVGFLNGTAHINSNILQFNSFIRYFVNFSGVIGLFIKTILLFFYFIVGPTIIGIVFVTASTTTLPTTKIGRYIVAFLLAFFVFYTKLFTDNPFGFFYAILFCNLCTPMLDDTVTCSQLNKNLTIIVLVTISLILGFIAFLFAMKGV